MENTNLLQLKSNPLHCQWNVKNLFLSAVQNGPTYLRLELLLAQAALQGYDWGLAMGLKIPVVGISLFDLYLAATPDAFVAIDSGRGDFFVAAPGLNPCTMEIEELETKQMEWPRTVGHRPFDLRLGENIVKEKIASGNIEPVVPMYLRPSYAEQPKDK